MGDHDAVRSLQHDQMRGTDHTWGPHGPYPNYGGHTSLYKFEDHATRLMNVLKNYDPVSDITGLLYERGTPTRRTFPTCNGFLARIIPRISQCNWLLDLLFPWDFLSLESHIRIHTNGLDTFPLTEDDELTKWVWRGTEPKIIETRQVTPHLITTFLRFGIASLSGCEPGILDEIICQFVDLRMVSHAQLAKRCNFDQLHKAVSTESFGNGRECPKGFCTEHGRADPRSCMKLFTDDMHLWTDHALLTQLVVRGPPKISKKRKARKDELADATPCGICLEPLADAERLEELSCEHVFCQECIRGWVKQKRMQRQIATCPSCRGDILRPKKRVLFERELKGTNSKGYAVDKRLTERWALGA